MLVIPGRAVHNAQGRIPLELGKPERDAISGKLLMSLRTANDQRVLAVHMADGSTLILSKSLAVAGAAVHCLERAHI